LKDKYQEFLYLETPSQGFYFFCPPALRLSGRIKERQNQQPPHIAAHLQAHTSQRSNQWLAKELQFALRTISD
jgi:hypothetical protein